MRSILLPILLGSLCGCGATYDRRPGSTDPSGDSDTDTDSDSDSDSDTDSDTDPDTGPSAVDAVGDCLGEGALVGATELTLTTLYEGDIPYSVEIWEAIPAVSVIGDAAAWDAFQASAGLTPTTVNFAAARVVVATDWRASTCGLTLEGVSGWTLADGSGDYVEAKMRIDGGEGCDTGCAAMGSRMIVVEVPTAAGVRACRRTETFCG